MLLQTCRGFSRITNRRTTLLRYFTDQSITDSGEKNHRHHLTNAKKKKVVFLGTPAVAVTTLTHLLEEANRANSLFEIVAVVTKQGGEGAGRHTGKKDRRKSKSKESDMLQVCEKHGLPQFSPNKASDPDFLLQISALEPDLCITAAYGHYLPPSFLRLPRYGTLNIHPSLLPRYRGAAPLQRSLERGDEIVGVSVLYTIREMDAGPLVAQTEVKLKGNEKSCELLPILFRLGTEALVQNLPAVFAPGNILQYDAATSHSSHGDSTGSGSHSNSLSAGNRTSFSTAQALHLSQLPHVQTQDAGGECASTAPKVTADEAQIAFCSMSASDIHNRCRGFSEWPGVWAYFYMLPPSDDSGTSADGLSSTDHGHSSKDIQHIKIKLITTKLVEDARAASGGDRSLTPNEICSNEVIYHPHQHDGGGGGSGSGREGKHPAKGEGHFLVRCGDGSVLAVEELQPTGKKVMRAKNFFNGLRGRRLMYVVHAEAGRFSTEKASHPETVNVP